TNTASSTMTIKVDTHNLRHLRRQFPALSEEPEQAVVASSTGRGNATARQHVRRVRRATPRTIRRAGARRARTLRRVRDRIENVPFPLRGVKEAEEVPGLVRGDVCHRVCSAVDV